MSQTSPQRCNQCQVPLVPGQSFCQNCGAHTDPSGSAPTVAAFQPMPPTISSVPPTPLPIVAAPQPTPPLAPPSYTNYAGVSPAYEASAPPPPTYTTGDDPYSAQPPAPPSDPYSVQSYVSAPNTAYGTGYPYTAPQPKKRSNVGLIVGIVVLVLVLACGGSFWAIGNGMNNATKGLNGTSGSDGGGGGSNFADSSNVSNLTITYANDQISFTSLQQQAKFDDDTLTKYGSKSNYVRINFREKQDTARYSSVSYRSSFRLVLPDKSVVSAENAGEYSGPDQGVERSNWVDFGTSRKVNLNNLILRVGQEDENKMEFALKSGADVSQYQPKTTSPNKGFMYAKMNWTLKSATQSLYGDGEQAKTGKVFITVQLVVNNNSSSEYYLYTSFVRLKAGSDTISPEYSSDSSNFDIIKPNTTNIQGSLDFKITQPTDGQYTLVFENIKDYDGNVTSGPTVTFAFP